MSLKNSKFRKALQGMIQKYWPDAGMHEELMQEALVHFWCERKAQRRGTASWHVESCHYYLKRYLDRGHSVDSYKHRHGRVLPADQHGAGIGPSGWREGSVAMNHSTPRSTEMIC